MKTILIALLLLPFTVSAKELPDMPKPHLDRKVFATGVALLAASKIADQSITRINLNNGAYEADPLFGRHPSVLRQSSVSAAAFLIDAGVFYLTERERHAWVRWAGRAYVGLVSANHLELAACGAGLNPHSTHMQRCHPLLPF